MSINVNSPIFNLQRNISFSELTRTVLKPNLKVKILDRTLKYIYFNRKDLALSEYSFAFNFCRVIIEKFGFKVRLRHDIRIRFGNKLTETTVKLDLRPKAESFGILYIL